MCRVIAFVHDAPATRVLFGAGTVGRVPDEVRRLGATRVLLVGGHRADPLAEALGALVAARITSVEPHVPAPAAAAAVSTAERGVDLVVSMGGGSATGLAKIVALRTGLPVLAVATTYAGSELSPIWGITEDGRKTTGRDRAVVPAVAVYDPELTLSLPPAVSASSGMNALAHLVEACWAPDVSPMTVQLAGTGIRTVVDALPRVVAAPEDLAARTDALYGAWLGGWALGTALMGLHHRICHVLGGRYDLPHAETHAAVLPSVVAYNQVDLPALGPDPAGALRSLAARIGAPVSLRDVGYDPGWTAEAARLVAAAPPPNPRPVTEAAVREVLTAAYG
jgi:maleylacetate reductase